jgi:hypothetical protein
MILGREFHLANKCTILVVLIFLMPVMRRDLTFGETEFQVQYT